MPSSRPVEIEACLAAVGDSRAALFESLQREERLGGLWRGELTRLLLADRYFDLADGQLARARAAVRLRRVDSDAGPAECLITLKGPALDRGVSSVRRFELESQWSPDALEAVFAGLDGLGIRLESPHVAPADRTDPERALAAAGFVAIQSRRTTRLAAELREGSTRVADLVFDEVRYTIGRRTIVHREIEIEARGESGAERVEAIAAELAARHPGDLRPWPWSKVALGRALEELEERGELDALLAGDELSPEGYLAVEARLGE